MDPDDPTSAFYLVLLGLFAYFLIFHFAVTGGLFGDEIAHMTAPVKNVH